jgi:hypothetical protein
LFALVCASASADSITVNGEGAPGETIHFSENSGVSDTGAQWAGGISINLTTGGTTTNDLQALCVDLLVQISTGTYTTVIYNPSNTPGHNAANLERAAWLVEAAFAPVVFTSITSTAIPKADWATTNAQAAGLQLAMWDIMQDGGDGFSAGTVRSDSQTNATVLQWANTYESLSVGQLSTLAYVLYNNNGSAQTLILPENPPSVPEPSTFTLGAVALIGAFALRRRLCAAAISAAQPR